MTSFTASPSAHKFAAQILTTPPQGFATHQGLSIAIFEKLFALSTHLEQVF